VLGLRVEGVDAHVKISRGQLAALPPLLPDGPVQLILNPLQGLLQPPGDQPLTVNTAEPK
jgi:hypothetical protein